MTVIIANIIDLIAAGIQVASGSIRQKAKILVVQIVQLLLQGVSMLLLGGITGAVSNVLSCWRNYLCYKEKLNRVWKAILIAASAVMTVLFNEQGIWGLIPVTVCTVYILFMDVKNPVQFKLLVTLTFLPWMVYHFVLRSYVGAIFDGAAVITNGITLLSMVRAKKSQQDKSG